MTWSTSKLLRVGIPGIIISLLAIWFIVSQIDFRLFIEALQTARYIYLLPCIVFLLLGLVTRARRWQVLLNNALILPRAFRIMNVAYLVNGVLPLRIGEVARVYLAAQGEQSVPIPQTTSTIIVERLLDLLAVVVMLLLALSVAPVPVEIQRAGMISAVLAMSGFLLLVLLAANRAFLHRLLDRLQGAAPEQSPFWQRFPIRKWLDQFLDGLLPITQPQKLLSVIGWTALSWILSIIAGYWLMFAFFEQGDIATTMLYIAAAAFAIALPAVPGNVGTYEASILLALVAMGYPQSGTTLAFAVMVHAVNVFVHASTGVIGFIQEGISLGQLRTGVQHMNRQ
jgi:hypothetical protein